MWSSVKALSKNLAQIIPISNMKLFFTLLLILVNAIFLKCQERLFITAPTGLIVRSAPSVYSERSGKLPYGSVVELLEKTNSKVRMMDNEKEVEGSWFKIKYDNFPYIISEPEVENFEDVGYIFSYYTEKLNKAKIIEQEISATDFKKLSKKHEKNMVKKITSQKEVEQILSNQLKWKEVKYLGYTIDEITLDNGQVLKINQKSNDYGFVAYYPAERIILFEGGHTSDYSISLKYGESLETAGNPEYIVKSPNDVYRLNGWFPGQQCSSYFFQKKSGSKLIYLTDFGWGSEQNGSKVCTMKDFTWLNDGEFVYHFTDYLGQKTIKKYLKAKIVEY